MVVPGKGWTSIQALYTGLSLVLTPSHCERGISVYACGCACVLIYLFIVCLFICCCLLFGLLGGIVCGQPWSFVEEGLCKTSITVCMRVLVLFNRCHSVVVLSCNIDIHCFWCSIYCSCWQADSIIVGWQFAGSAVGENMMRLVLSIFMDLIGSWSMGSWVQQSCCFYNEGERTSRAGLQIIYKGGKN